MMRLLILLCVLVFALPASAQLDSASDFVEEPADDLRVSALDVLTRALDNLYACDLSRGAEFRTFYRGKQVRTQRVVQLRKRIEGRAHTLFDYLTTNEFYGLRSLRIERLDRDADRFLWLPDLLRVRRLSSAQGADRVFGSDIRLGDLETRRPEQFEVIGRSTAGPGGAHRIEVRPLFETDYDWAEMLVGPVHFETREIAYYRDGASEPHRHLEAPVDEMLMFPGHLMPGRWVIDDHVQKTRTEVVFGETVVDPVLEDRLFSVRTLEEVSALPKPRAAVPDVASDGETDR